MKITIKNTSVAGKTESIEVTSYLPFEMFGYTFAAHRRPGMPGWRVSETSTGKDVVTAETRREAIQNAKMAIERRGAAELKAAVEMWLGKGD